MEEDLQRRDELLCKAKESILALSKENDMLEGLLRTKAEEIERITAILEEQAINAVNVEANTTGEFLSVEIQPFTQDSTTPSLISADEYNTSLNNIEMRRSEEIMMLKKEMELQLEGEEQIFRSKIDSLNQQNILLKDSEEELRSNLDQTEKQLVTYREQYSEAQKESMALESVNEEYEEMKEEFLNEKKANDTMEGLLQIAETRIAEEEQEFEIATTEMSEDKTSIKKLKQQVVSLKCEIETLTDENKHLISENKDAVKDCSDGKQREKEAEEEVQQLMKANTDLDALCQKHVRDGSAKDCEIEKLEAENADLERQLAEETEELVDLRVLTENAVELEEKFTELQTSYERSDNERKTSETLIHDLSDQMVELKEELARHTRDNAALEFEKKSSETALKDLEEENNERELLIDELIGKVSMTEAANETLTANNQAFAEQIEHESKETRKENADLKEQNEEFVSKISQIEEQIEDKNELITKLTSEKVNAEARETLLHRLFDEVLRELQIYVSPENSREDIEAQFQEIINEIKIRQENYSEAQELVQEFKSAIERLNEKQLKEEQLLKLAKDEVIRKQENETLLSQTVSELQKQVTFQAEQILNMQTKLEGEEEHKERLKQYVEECKEKIGVYELKNEEYHNELESREADVENEVSRLHEQVATSIEEFSFNVLQELRSENKEQAINEILKLSKTFLV